MVVFVLVFSPISQSIKASLPCKSSVLLSSSIVSAVTLPETTIAALGRELDLKSKQLKLGIFGSP